MSLLHAYFHLRNQQAFQRLLDGSSARTQPSAGTAGSGSGSKSWNRGSSTLKEVMAAEVNARDWLGRTVLHLACASQDPSALEYVRMLLAHPAINVNLQDTESHWTALHRALYHGNLALAILLLQRVDVDTSLQDLEGYTAFDLYNSTIEDAKPFSFDERRAELFTWGANRNATLGLGDSNDRTHPEQVVVRKIDNSSEAVEHRFSPIHVRQIAMSRLHTTVVTNEGRNNLRVCGFGSGGRLGPGQHTQYSLTTIPTFTHTILSVALGQDHTLALTTSGEVLSWGLNRFAQLGYVIEPTSAVAGRLEEPMQASPRKIVALKKEVVKGVSACKTASACWTEDHVFTWGTNGGQLGYDRVTQPVQVLPRIVPKFSEPVEAITLTDSAMACLLETYDVICIWNDRHAKIIFSTQNFPPGIHYRPPQSTAKITKVASCDNTFVALSTDGEVFMFNVPASLESDATSGKGSAAIKPQRVWTRRKKFSAVKDVAPGPNGSLIICTESGHVFIGSRNVKSGQGSPPKAIKYQRMPYIQRVIKVAANSTGAFGALRLDYVPNPINVTGNDMAKDLAEIQPYLRFPGEIRKPGNAAPSSTPLADAESSPNSDEAEDVPILNDIKDIKRLCRLLALDREVRKEAEGHGLFADVRPAHGGDLIAQVQKLEFPVHRVILAARSDVLGDVISGKRHVSDVHSNISVKMDSMSSSSTRLVFSGCQALSVLIFCTYLYSDELPAIWDGRVSHAVWQDMVSLKIKHTQIRQELQALARMLQLPLLIHALEAPAKRTPVPSIARDMDRLFQNAQTGIRAPCPPDVVLQLADKEVYCHSAVLRARSPFFASFFDDEDWTLKRWNSDGAIIVKLTHLNWRVMQLVLRFMCSGSDDIFESLDYIQSVDELLEFVFEVMAAASELLLDRLVLLASSVILRYVNINNACFILADASYLSAMDLVQSVRQYMAVTLETLLESRMLDDLTPELIKHLSGFIRLQQARKCPVTRNNQLAIKALERNADWIALQDIPQPIVRASRRGALKDSVRLSPSGPSRITRQISGSGSPQALPVSRPTRLSSVGDDIFVMDDADFVPALDLGPSQEPASDVVVSVPLFKPAGSWKPLSSGPRVDMRSIMAEAESSKASTSKGPVPSTSIDASELPAKWVQKTPQRDQRKLLGENLERATTPRTPTRASSSSPWNISPLQAPLNHTKGLSTPPALETPVGTSPSGIARMRDNLRQESTSRPSSALPTVTQQHNEAVSRKQGGQSGLGPVYNPPRVSSKEGQSASRRVAGPAWTMPPVEPVVIATPATSALSFAAIQQMQMEQDVGTGKGKQSLRDIQEEEKARREEEDFMRWWAAEEERVKLEMQDPSATPEPKKPKQSRRLKPTKPKAPVQEASQVAFSKDSSPKERKSARGARTGRSSAHLGEHLVS